MTAPPLFALRPVNAVLQLAAAPEACPLSLRHVLRGLGKRRGAVPVVVAPTAAVARGALVAAYEANAVIGLALLPGVAAEAWFAAVARAAHELAPRLPFFTSGEVRVDEGGVERAQGGVHRLLDAGITHLAIDLTAVKLGKRAQAASAAAGFVAEREIAVDCVIPAAGLSPEAAVHWVDEFEGWGVRADLASVRLPAPADERQAREQLALLDAVSAALGGRPVLRRGPLAPALTAQVRGSRLRACEDGGAALAAAVRAIPPELRAAAGGEGRRGPIELPEEVSERFEALAYAEVCGLIDALGASGTATQLEAALRAPPES